MVDGLACSRRKEAPVMRAGKGDGLENGITRLSRRMGAEVKLKRLVDDVGFGDAPTL